MPVGAVEFGYSLIATSSVLFPNDAEGIGLAPGHSGPPMHCSFEIWLSCVLNWFDIESANKIVMPDIRMTVTRWRDFTLDRCGTTMP